MATQNTNPVIYWILQNNQVTPNLIDFLDHIRQRVSEFLTLTFLVPETDLKTRELVSKLSPVVFKISSQSKPNSYEGYCRKRDQLGDSAFSQGLTFRQALLLDDLGSGNLYQALVHPPKDIGVAGIVLQIPSPLGSSESEERIFYSWVHLAKINHAPIVGYELLPLAARWTLAPSLVDAVITTRKESHAYLSDPVAGLSTKLWRLPAYEGKFFSPATHPIWRNGLGVRYRHQDIPMDKTILYIPHNVAMTYEYKNLLEILEPEAENLHLMLSYGKDQIRGGYPHQQIIETVCEKQLPSFSYSFHDLSRPWEITMADAAVACSDCYITEVSSAMGIPAIIYDPMVPSGKTGHKTWVQLDTQLLKLVRHVVHAHARDTELARILIDMARGNVAPQSRAPKGNTNG